MKMKEFAPPGGGRTPLAALSPATDLVVSDPGISKTWDINPIVLPHLFCSRKLPKNEPNRMGVGRGVIHS